MSTTTEQYPDFTGMTFEKVWAALMENREQQKETGLQIAELKLEIAENGRYLKETERQMKESSKRVDEQLGRLGNRFGEVMEAVVRPGVAAKFNELGYQFPGESHNLIIKDPATGNRKTELDVILENGESVIVVEIKINPDIKDVKHFAEQLQYYREYRNQLNPNDSKKIFGALAAAVFPDNIQKAALDSGYYVIVPSGESIKIVFPEGFVPMAF